MIRSAAKKFGFPQEPFGVRQRARDAVVRNGIAGHRRRVAIASGHASRTMDIDKLRKDTPGVEHVTHFNNAGSSLPTSEVVGAASRWMELEAQIGGYEAIESSPELLEAPYSNVAKLINCEPSEVAIVTSATLAWQQVFFGIDFQKGDRILTSVAEYGSNYINFLQVAQKFGAVIEVIPEDDQGDIDVGVLEEMLQRAPARLVAITHIPTSSGRVYSAAAAGEVAHAAGVPYLLDACQSVGQMPIDVQELKCDFLSATGRKYLRAPRGSGFLYASKSAMQKTAPAMLDVWGAEWESPTAFSMFPTARRYESYEMSFAAKVGLGVAVQYALDLTMEAIWVRIQELAAAMRKGLRDVEGVEVLDKGRTLCGIVSFTKAGVPPEEIKKMLSSEGVNVSVSMRRSTLLDFDERELQKVVRASVHYYNTLEEVQVLVEHIAKM